MDAGSSRTRWQVIAAAVGLLLVAGLGYANSFGGPFVFDDWPTIQENPSIRAAGWWAAFHPPPDNSASGRPLLNATLALNFAATGERVWSYHAFNLLIHALSGVTLFGLVRRTLRQPGAPRRFAAHATALAWIIAALWTSHPLHTESVTYLVQRAESLMGLCYFATLYAFARAIECGPVGDTAKAGGARFWALIAVTTCGCGMATKEVMVSAPIMALLYDRAFVAGSFRAAWSRHRGLLLGLAATWLVLGYGLASTGGNRNGSVGFGSGVTFLAYWLTQPRALVTYLTLAPWPHPLVFEYGTEWITRARDVVPYAALVVPLVAAAVVALWRWPRVGFLAAWFFFPLAVTSLMPGINQMIVEHRMYLSLAALIAAAVLLVSVALATRVLLISAAVTAAMLVTTLRRNCDYRDEVTLWADTVAKRPGNALAHRILADCLWQGRDEFRAEQIPGAKRHYEIALRLNPGSPITHENYGAALLLNGEFPAGLAETRAALRLDPDRYLAHYNLGLAYVGLGQIQDAAAEFRTATRLRPDYVNAHKNLGNALSESGQPAAAVACFEAALRLAPGDADALYNYGNALFRLGRFADAEPRYRAALRLTPRDADAHEMLGRTLTRLERRAEAAPELERAAALRTAASPASRPPSAGWQVNRARR